jgi:hypothetical protein
MTLGSLTHITFMKKLSGTRARQFAITQRIACMTRYCLTKTKGKYYFLTTSSECYCLCTHSFLLTDLMLSA